MSGAGIPVTPRPAATTMLLRDSAQGELEVLLLRRSPTLAFAAGAHVFPGGAVDPGDTLAHAELAPGRTDASASSVLRVPARGLAYWVAAIRECLEEVGLVLADHPDGTPLADDHPLLDDIDAARRDVLAGTVALADLYRRHQLHLPVGRAVYVSHWITPAISPRRFDTRFFAVAAPEGQVVDPDPGEAVEAAWWRPVDALEAFAAREIELIEPTMRNLQLLARYATTETALADFAWGEARPQRIRDGGGERIVLATDDTHEPERGSVAGSPA